MKQQIIDLLASRGKVPTFGVPGIATVVIQDDSDGDGPFIAYWDVAALGPLPSEEDGFTVRQLRRIEKGRLKTGDELHQERIKKVKK